MLSHTASGPAGPATALAMAARDTPSPSMDLLGCTQRKSMSPLEVPHTRKEPHFIAPETQRLTSWYVEVAEVSGEQKGSLP